MTRLRALARAARDRHLVAVELAGVLAVVEGIRGFSPAAAWIVGGALAIFAVERQPRP